MEFYETINQIFSKTEDIRPDVNKLQSEYLFNGENAKRFEIILKIFFMREVYSEEQKIFHPHHIIGDTSGVVLSDLTEEEWKILKLMDFNRFNFVVAAKLSDAIWVEKRDPLYGNLAVKKYLEIGESLLKEEPGSSFLIKVVERGYTIATQLSKRGALQKEVLTFLDNCVMAFGIQEARSYLEIIAWMKVKKINLKDEWLQKLDDIIKKSDNDNYVYHAYLLKIKVSTQNAATLRQVKDDFSHWLEKCAQQEESIKKEELLVQAYTYRNDKKEKRGILKAIEQVRMEISQKITGHELDIPEEFQEYLKKLYNQLRTLDWESSLKLVIFVMSSNELNFEKLSLSQENSLVDIFQTKVIGDYGNPIKEIPSAYEDDPEEIRKQYRFSLLLSLAGDIYLKPLFENMKEPTQKDIKMLQDLLTDSDLIENNRKNIVTKGFLEAFDGQYYSALHILAPQFEHSLRLVIQQKGGLLFRQNKNGTAPFKVGQDLVSELEGMIDTKVMPFITNFFTPKGSNIRNLVAHGEVEENQANDGKYLAFIAFYLNCLVMLKTEEEPASAQ